MSGKRRDLTADEERLWRRVAATTKARRSHSNKAAADVDAPPQTRAKSVSVKSLPPAVRPATGTLSPPASRAGEKRVRRGRVEIGATLDLHGHTQASARSALERFLGRAQTQGARAVVVVTGYGRGGEGVLKRRLPDWLAEVEIRALVSGWAPAHRAHGGAGAFYVFLKRKP